MAGELNPAQFSPLHDAEGPVDDGLQLPPRLALEKDGTTGAGESINGNVFLGCISVTLFAPK